MNEDYSNKKDIATQCLLEEQKRLTEFYKARYIKLKEKLYGGVLAADYETWKETGGAKELQAYIECLAAAYMKQCNINPLKAVLHTGLREKDNEICYWITEEEIKPESINQFKVYE